MDADADANVHAPRFRGFVLCLKVYDKDIDVAKFLPCVSRDDWVCLVIKKTGMQLLWAPCIGNFTVAAL